MSRIVKLNLITVLLLCLLASCLFAANIAFAESEGESLTPSRSTEFGDAVGERITIGNKVYQNFARGYVVADKISETQVQNKRDIGGKNINANGVETYVEMEDYIKSLSPVSTQVRDVYAYLYNKYGLDVAETVPEVYGQQAISHIMDKIYNKYKSLTLQGYNCGIPTEGLSIWDGEVVKVDFYDGDSEYGFGDSRTNVSTVAYSFLKDDAFVIEGDIFNFYREAKAGSLAEPITDRFDYTYKDSIQINGIQGQAQGFAQGYIFCPADGSDIIVRAGVRWNEEREKFEVLELSKEQLTKTEIIDLEGNEYYAGKGLTTDKIKDLFYNKYLALIDSGFNPGIPDHEGIYYWDGYLIKQAYVGSDGTGNAWGRTNMMLVFNPDTEKVYMVYDKILNIVDKASHGLGTALSLGYPLGEMQTAEINGLTYYYQDFLEGTIYSIENVQQLTRFIKGKTFKQAVSDNASQGAGKANPSFYYVMEPWLIAVICVAGLLVIATVVLFATGAYKKIFKSKSKTSDDEVVNK